MIVLINLYFFFFCFLLLFTYKHFKAIKQGYLLTIYSKDSIEYDVVTNIKHRKIYTKKHYEFTFWDFFIGNIA